MNYHKIEKTSIANGTGVRCVLWVSGCSIHCCGCQNPNTWSIDSGIPFDEKAKQELFTSLDHPYIQGITFSGGHPLEPENLSTIYSLIQEIKENFPQKDIWLYTGLSLIMEDFEILPNTEDKNDHFKNHILSMCDVVVDGAYVEELRDITLPFRGSTNQRLIDVKKSIIKNEIVLYEL